MDFNIKIPILQLESINQLASINSLIETYSADTYPLTSDVIESIYTDSNISLYPYKMTQLTMVLFDHISRNNIQDLVGDLTNKLSILKSKIQPSEYNNAYALLSEVSTNTTYKKFNDKLMYSVKDAKEYLSQKIFTSQYSPFVFGTYGHTQYANDNDSDDSVDVSDAESFSETASMLDFLKELDQTTNLSESVTVNKVADKVKNTVVNAALKDKEISESLNEKFNRFIKIVKDSKKNAAYDKYVKDTVNLSRILKNMLGGMLLFIAFPGSPLIRLIVTAIGLIAKFALDKRTDMQHRRIILSDIEFELKIVQSKLQDAERKGDIKAKYRLMRIVNEMEKTIERIKSNIRLER